jgi:hypothetical protein
VSLPDHFAKNPDLSGGIAMILLSKNPGYPDIAVGGRDLNFLSVAGMEKSISI